MKFQPKRRPPQRPVREPGGRRDPRRRRGRPRPASRSAPSSFERRSTAQAWADLESNRPAGHLIRLIAYDPQKEPGLAIDRLERLGPPDQLYSFVASYEEMAGYTATGTEERPPIERGQHVSAIIFPRRSELYPANARGLLQIIRAVEQEKRRGGRRAVPRRRERAHRGRERRSCNLETDGASYRVSDFREAIRAIASWRAGSVRSGPLPGQPLHRQPLSTGTPLGFSQIEPARDPCTLPAAQYCAFADWSTARAEVAAAFRQPRVLHEEPRDRDDSATS